MKRVFFGGSRRVSRLNEVVRRRIEEIVHRQLEVVVGDANGADKALQRQLAAWQYPHVLVYFVGTKPRNNEGHWPTRRIPTPAGLRGFEFYAAKDRAMAADSEAGLMLWDGESRGTLANARTLVEAGKPVTVYVAPWRRFVNVLSPADLETLSSQLKSPPAPEEQPRPASGLQGALDLDTKEQPSRRHRRRNTA